MTTEIKLNTPCVITSKDGESKLVGFVMAKGEKVFGFQVKGAVDDNSFWLKDWTFEFPIPPLPTEPGTVIESGGVRFFRDDEGWWWASKRVGKVDSRACGEDTMEAHLAAHNGFTVLLAGIKEGEK